MRSISSLALVPCLALFAFAAAAQAPQNSGPNTLSSTPAPDQDSRTTAAATVSVPLHDGDPLNVTGPLAIRTRGTHHYAVIESPTPYRITNHIGSPEGQARPHIIRDIGFTLAGQTEDLSSLVGQTVTASGTVHLQPTPVTWNGLVLQSKTLILPGGRQLHAR